MEFWQKAIGYLQGKEGYDLSDSEKVKFNQCKQIKIWIAEHGISETLNMGVMDFELSERQVRRVFNDAVKIFGDDTQLSKNFLLQIAYDDIRETRRLAKQSNDIKILAQTDKNMLTLIKNHFGDADTPDFDKIQPPTVLIQYNPTLVLGDKLQEENLEQELAILSRPKRKNDIFEDAKIVEKNE